MNFMIETPKRKHTNKQINNVVISDFKGTLFVWGPKSSGKYTTIKSVLERNNRIYCEADCNDHYSTTSLFRALLSTLRNIDLNRVHYGEDRKQQPLSEDEELSNEQIEENRKIEIIKLNNLSEMFDKMITQSQYYTKKIPLTVSPSIAEMIKVLYEKASTNKTISIILRHSEKLMKFERDFLYSLYKIEEFTECPVCVYLLSEIPKERIISTGKEFKPIRSIHFTQYEPDEVCLIVLNFYPNFDAILANSEIILTREKNIQLYKKLVELIVRIFYTTTKDIIDIIFVSHNLYPKYIQPILSKKCTLEDNDSILYENINSKILKSLLNITEKNQIVEANIISPTITTNTNTNTIDDSNNIPHHMKILLICCFLASTFGKTKDKLLYTKEAVKRQSQSTEKSTGSKWFHYQRAKEIGYKLFPTEKKTLFNEHIFKTLANLRYLETINTIEASFTYKFRCTRKIHLDFIKKISKSINFDIDSYLEAADFQKDTK